MSTAKSYVREDGSGTWRVGKTDVSLESVVYAFLQGHSAETIAQQYPALSLEEVHGSIAFYLAHREEVQQYLARQEERWAEFRRQADAKPSPVIERLRAARARSLQEKG
jgi:uncharacterized protein (DUF433 family)